MSDTRYARVIEDFCRLVGFDDVNGLIHRGQLLLDEVVFTLRPGGPDAPEAVLVYCDFGEPPPARAAEAYLALLGSNLFLFAGGEASFCALPSNGRVALASRIPLAEFGAEALLKMLQGQAETARVWRENHFLAEPPAGAQPLEPSLRYT